MFFFISGFIITTLMLREYDLHGTVALKSFYLRRLFRLMPALLVFLIVCCIFLFLVNGAVRTVELISALFFFSNYLTIFGSFDGIGFYSPISIVWSLSVEEHFYLVWPFVFLLIGSRAALVRIVLAGLVMALSWRCILVFGVGLENLPHYRIYKATDTRFDSILFGVLFALIGSSSRFYGLVTRRSVVGVGILLLISGFAFRSDEFRESIRYSIQGVGLLLVFHFMIFQATLVGTVLRSAWMQFFGKISYSLYLYHWLVFVLVQHHLSDFSLLAKMGLMLSASIALAWLSFRFVEQPCLRFGRGFVASRAAQRRYFA